MNITDDLKQQNLESLINSTLSSSARADFTDLRNGIESFSPSANNRESFKCPRNDNNPSGKVDVFHPHDFHEPTTTHREVDCSAELYSEKTVNSINTTVKT